MYDISFGFFALQVNHSLLICSSIIITMSTITEIYYKWIGPASYATNTYKRKMSTLHVMLCVQCAMCRERERVYEMMMNRWMDYGLWTLCDYGAHE